MLYHTYVWYVCYIIRTFLHFNVFTSYSPCDIISAILFSKNHGVIFFGGIFFFLIGGWLLQKKVDGSFKVGNPLRHRQGRDGYKELKFLVNALARSNFTDINKKLGVAVFTGIFFLPSHKNKPCLNRVKPRFCNF